MPCLVDALGVIVLLAQRAFPQFGMEGTFEIEMFTFLMNLLHFQGEKENSLKTDDYGRDLSSVQTLLTKQVSANAASTL